MTSIERLTTIGGGLAILVLATGTSGHGPTSPRPQAARPPAASRAHQVEVGNPTVGKRLFTQKGCVQCHAIRGEGGQVGPDLGRIPHTHNLYTMAAVLWNHAPQMRQVMAAQGIERPEFHGSELAHLLAYLHSLEVIGDPVKGRGLFTSKGCVQCHAIAGEGGKIGPDLGQSAHPHPPIELIGMMWNHSPAMTAIMRGLGLERPVFAPGELANLLAYLRAVQTGPGSSASGQHHGSPGHHDDSEGAHQH